MELPTPKRDSMLQHLMMVLVFALPWAKKALPTIIALITLIAIIYFLRRKQTYRPTEPLAIAGLLSLFILHIAGTTYTEHPHEAWNEVGIKLSFLIFPILSVLLPNFRKQEIEKIHHWFVAGCFVFIGITLVRAGINAYHHQHLYYLTYDQLSWYMHPTYAAAYQAMALFLLVEQMQQRKFTASSPVLHVGACLLVLLYIALLSSKAGYLTFLLVVGFSFVRCFHWKFSALRGAFISLMSVLLFALVVIALPTSAGRIGQAVEDIRSTENNALPSDTTQEPSHTSSTALRPVTWSASWTLLRENAFGTGTGDTQPSLNTLYLQRAESYAAERNLNAHNQYLQTGAELGWFGLLALLTGLGALWRVRKSEITVACFAGLFAFNFLFESMLEVQAGIVFFCAWVLVYSKIER